MEKTPMLLDSDDVGDVIYKIEKQFRLKLDYTAFRNMETFGEVCDHIAGKIQLQHTDDCTSQQAFYKLCNAIAFVMEIEAKTIHTGTKLDILFPSKGRRNNIKAVESLLGFKFDILQPNLILWKMMCSFLLLSVIVICFTWRLGLPVLLFSVAGLWLAGATGKAFSIVTVKELSMKIAREHYLECRRNPDTFNKREIHEIMAGLVLDHAQGNIDLKAAKIL